MDATGKIRPRILFILHLPPPVHGAAMMGKYIRDSKLINEIFDCRYINLTTAKSLQDIGKESIGKLFKFICLLMKIIKAVFCFKPQLVYITPNACGGAFYKDFVVVQLLKLLGCKVVAHYHNKGVATRQDYWLDNRLYRCFFKGIKLILLAETLYKDVEKYVDRKNVYICPNGIPETLSEEPSAERHNRVPHLLFLSNLLVSKGVLVLLDACKILKDKGYSFVCEFVGGETAEIDAGRFAEEVRMRGLNEIAIYKGRKYGKEKSNAFNTVDVFTFPTFYHNETFGLVNLEAMEHKLPVVTTDEGGIVDVVKNGENGMITEKQNPASLADCIEKLLGDKKLREKMGEDGYRKFKTYFKLQAFEQNFVDIVKNLSGGVNLNIIINYGKKFGADKSVFFNNADIFIFPTFYSNECFPLVLLEAMQQALPCISTDEGGISKIIENGKTGYIVPRNSADALAEKIAYLIDNPEEKMAMGRRGRERFVQEFTIGIFEKNIKHIIKQAL